jgi:hypothetical protein
MTHLILKGGKFGGDDVFRQRDQIYWLEKLCSTHIASLGYFTNFMTTPYNVTISHPEHYGVASMTDQDPSATSDTFITSRYAG